MKPKGAIRWRCLLCSPARWHIGTWADWSYHYSVMHPPQDGDS